MATKEGDTIEKHGEFRTTWPEGELTGKFNVCGAVINETVRALVTFRGPDRSHEGIVFWGGYQYDGITTITTVVVPKAKHGPQFVQCDERSIREVSQIFRRYGLGLLVQVHSHPSEDARHSFGDDRMVFMPFEGMLSLVVPWYAKNGMLPLSGCGIHQFQKGRWVLCTSGFEAIKILPAGVDTRG